MQSPRAGAGRKRDEVRNHHPTVKPIRLMRWLCRLVTPPGGLVVDPFAGSGSTGVAAVLEGFAFVGCELDAGHVAIAEARIGHAETSPGEWADTAPGGKRKKAAKVAKVRKVKVKAALHPSLFGW
jgi:site-specific DNA-methyltransferase (adenine-specific)